MIESAAVDLYISEADEKWQFLLRELRHLMFQHLPPNSQEHIRYKIPFYYYRGPLCYLNPRKTHLDLGFYRGAELSNEQGILEGDGKLVRHIHFLPTEPDKVNSRSVAEVLQEAILLNEEFYNLKKK